MSEHTPEPWEVVIHRACAEDMQLDYLSIEGPMVGRQGVICDTLNRDCVIDPDEDRANADLLASAPRLLDENKGLREANAAMLDTLEFAARAIGRQTQFWNEDAILARVLLDIEETIAETKGVTP